MTDTHSNDGHGSGQGRDAQAAGHGAADDADLPEGERMARRLVQDVAAYEVDPPPPSRVADGAEPSGQESGEQSGQASPTP